MRRRRRRRRRRQVITPGPDGMSNAEMQPLEAATKIVRGSMTRSRDMRALMNVTKWYCGKYVGVPE